MTPTARRLVAAQDEQQDERPQQIELLLDREAPQVTQGRRRERAEVRRTGRDEAPVRDVAERRESVAAYPAEARVVRRHACDDRDHGEQDEQRRQQAPGPPAVEVAEAEPAVLGVLPDSSVVIR